MFKRLFDIVMALILGTLCLPLTLALALAVKLESLARLSIRCFGMVMCIMP